VDKGLVQWLRRESARWSREAAMCRAKDGSWKLIIDAVDCDAYAKWFTRLADELHRLDAVSQRKGR
jgi:hypothetical protein